MKNSNKQFQEWDKIFEELEKFKEENPNFHFNKRPKTFKDEDGEIRCTKCGATEDLSNCPECVSEKEYLKSKK